MTHRDGLVGNPVFDLADPKIEPKTSLAHSDIFNTTPTAMSQGIEPLEISLRF